MLSGLMGVWPLSSVNGLAACGHPSTSSRWVIEWCLMQSQFKSRTRGLEVCAIWVQLKLRILGLGVCTLSSLCPFESGKSPLPIVLTFLVFLGS